MPPVLHPPDAHFQPSLAQEQQWQRPAACAGGTDNAGFLVAFEEGARGSTARLEEPRHSSTSQLPGAEHNRNPHLARRADSISGLLRPALPPPAARPGDVP